MTETRPRMIFVNLAVRDLARTKAFWEGLGFAFDPRFTDEKAACMILSEQGYVMLLSDPFFQGFTRRTPCDTTTHTETMLALSCESREEVDAMMAKVLASGGTEAMPAQDQGFMYVRSFYDLDGHHWEPMWMDLAAALAAGGS
jgi:uncharacterized protein